MSWWWLLLVPFAYSLGVWHGFFCRKQLDRALDALAEAVARLFGKLGKHVSPNDGEVIDCEFREVR